MFRQEKINFAHSFNLLFGMVLKLTLQIRLNKIKLIMTSSNCSCDFCRYLSLGFMINSITQSIVFFNQWLFLAQVLASYLIWKLRYQVKRVSTYSPHLMYYVYKKALQKAKMYQLDLVFCIDFPKLGILLQLISNILNHFGIPSSVDLEFSMLDKIEIK